VSFTLSCRHMKRKSGVCRDIPHVYFFFLLVVASIPINNWITPRWWQLLGINEQPCGGSFCLQLCGGIQCICIKPLTIPTLKLNYDTLDRALYSIESS
jgi:hypothetical protein